MSADFRGRQLDGSITYIVRGRRPLTVHKIGTEHIPDSQTLPTICRTLEYIYMDNNNTVLCLLQY